MTRQFKFNLRYNPVVMKSKCLYSPQNWLILLAMGILWFLAHLPYRFILSTGRGLGHLAVKFGAKNQRIIMRNLELCFPELDLKQRQELSLKIWQSHAIAGIETAMAWWCAPKKFMSRLTIEGKEHLHAAQQTGRGIMLLTGHFTCLELQGRCVAELCSFAGTAKHLHNPCVDTIVERARLRYLKRIYYAEDLRQAQRGLQQGAILGFLLDQDYGRKGSVFAGFFNIPTATTTTLARIAQHTNSIVIPTFLFRNPDSAGYRLVFHPALEHYPSGDPVKDAECFNHIVEQAARQYPEQYGWTYRRFATRPEGEPSLYD